MLVIYICIHIYIPDNLFTDRNKQVSLEHCPISTGIVPIVVYAYRSVYILANTYICMYWCVCICISINTHYIYIYLLIRLHIIVIELT